MSQYKTTSKTCHKCAKLAYVKDDKNNSPVCTNARNFCYKDYAYKDIGATCVHFKFTESPDTDFEPIL